MNNYITIDKNSLVFCRIVSSLLIWVSVFVFRLPILSFLLISFLISSLKDVRYSVFVLSYRFTLGYFIRKASVMINIDDMRFMHKLATFFLILILLLSFVNKELSFGFLIFFAILKTFTALGYCPASKLRACIKNGPSSSCCSIMKSKKC